MRGGQHPLVDNGEIVEQDYFSSIYIPQDFDVVSAGTPRHSCSIFSEPRQEKLQNPTLLRLRSF